jgi:predicted phosphoribosyltransferase
MSKQQTVVEWLYSELSKNHISNDSIKSRIDKEEEIWKQAKAMEREQRERTFSKEEVIAIVRKSIATGLTAEYLILALKGGEQ